MSYAPEVVNALHAALGTLFSLDRFAEAKPTGKVSERGKIGIKAWARHEPFTVTHLQEHLDGAALRGLYLNVAEGASRSLCIDVDDYAGDLWSRIPAMLATARRVGWPLVPCRSKSGGAHLWAYCAAPTDAKLLKLRGEELLRVLELPADTEVFPKTASLPGSQVWLPYWGGGSSCMMGTDGLTPQPVEEWLRVLTGRLFVSPGVLASPVRTWHAHSATPAVVSAAVVAPPVVVERPEVLPDDSGSVLFPDGPPCLQAIERSGSDTHFTRDLARQVATYHRLRTGDEDAIAIAVTTTMKSLGDPIGLTVAIERTRSVVQAAEKRSLNYWCKQDPLQPLCDGAACRHRRFGVEATPTSEQRREKQQVIHEQAALAKTDKERRIAVNVAALRDRLGGEALRLTAYLSDTGTDRRDALHYTLLCGTLGSVDVENIAILNSLAKLQLVLKNRAESWLYLILDSVTQDTWGALVSELCAVREEKPMDGATDAIEGFRLTYVQFFADSTRQPDDDLWTVREVGGWCVADDMVYYRGKDLQGYLRPLGHDMMKGPARVVSKTMGVQTKNRWVTSPTGARVQCTFKQFPVAALTDEMTLPTPTEPRTHTTGDQL